MWSLRPPVRFRELKSASNYSAQKFQSCALPSLQRRGSPPCKGGVAPPPRNIAKPPKRRRRGGRAQALSRTHAEIWLVSDHPVRSLKEASRYFFDVASTPP